MLTIIAVFSLTVAVGVQDRPAEAPQEGPYVSTWKLFGTPTFAEAMAAIASIIFAYVNETHHRGLASDSVLVSHRHGEQYGL